MTTCTCSRTTYPRSLSDLCLWCQGTRTAHKRIEAGMAALGSDVRTRAGWDASVLAATAAPPATSRWRVPVLLMCLAALVLVGAKTLHLGSRVVPTCIELRIEQPSGNP